LFSPIRLSAFQPLPPLPLPPPFAIFAHFREFRDPNALPPTAYCLLLSAYCLLSVYPFPIRCHPPSAIRPLLYPFHPLTLALTGCVRVRFPSVDTFRPPSAVCRPRSAALRVPRPLAPSHPLSRPLLSSFIPHPLEGTFRSFILYVAALCYAFPVPFSLLRNLSTISDIFPPLHLKKSMHSHQKGVNLKKRVYDYPSTLTIARIQPRPVPATRPPSQRACTRTPGARLTRSSLLTRHVSPGCLAHWFIGPLTH
jgi:hypothetical protein